MMSKDSVHSYALSGECVDLDTNQALTAHDISILLSVAIFYLSSADGFICDIFASISLIDSSVWFIAITVTLVLTVVVRIPAIIRSVKASLLLEIMLLLAFAILIIHSASQYAGIKTCEAMYSSMARSFLLFCLPAYCCFQFVASCEQAKLADVSPICVLIIITYLIHDLLFPQVVGEYSMGNAYSILPALLFLIGSLVENKTSKKSIVYALTAIIGLILLVHYGTRGPLVFAVLFAVVLIAKRAIDQYRMKGAVIVAIAAISGIMLLMLAEGLLSQWANDHTSASRIFYYLGRGEFFANSGRDWIAEASLKIIQENPNGVGIGGDRVLLAEARGRGLATVAGSYPHNILLELIMQYGIALGVIIIVLLAVLIVFTLIKNETLSFSLVLALVFCGLAPLFLSSSYIIWPYFWGLLAVCASCLERLVSSVGNHERAGNGQVSSV